MPRQLVHGIISIICSAFSFALMALFVRLAGNLPFYQKCFFRNLVALMVASILLFRSKEKIKLTKTSSIDLFMRSSLGTLGLFCNFYAIDHLNLADASVLNKMSPFFAILMSILILKEKVNWKQALIVLGAFVGAIFVVKPSPSNFLLGPSLIALLGGFGAGSAYTFVRKLGNEKVKGSIIVFCFSLFSILVCIPFMIFSYHPMTFNQLGCLLLAGVFASIGQFTITYAYKCSKAREISVFDYTQIIFSSLLGFFLLGEIPDIWSLLGYFLIVLMAIFMAIYDYMSYRPKKTSSISDT